MENALLTIKDLSVQYVTRERTVAAINNLNLQLRKGDVLGLVGETGAGKTTLALSILGLLPKPVGKIKDGEIIFEDINLTALSERELQKIRGQKISMIFQDPMTSLNPVETVGEQICEVIRIHNRISKMEAMGRAQDMLEMVGIPRDRHQNYPHEFSGGMKQRIVIAIALACNPELLIADEPTTALDVTIQAQVLDLIKGLQEKSGTSVLMITHDMGIVAQMCNQVAVMYSGEIIEFGSAEQVFHNKSHPYTVGLFNALPSLTGEEKRLTPIKGSMPDPADLPVGCNFADRCPYAESCCHTQAPPVCTIEPGHVVKCFRYLKDSNHDGI